MANQLIWRAPPAVGARQRRPRVTSVDPGNLVGRHTRHQIFFHIVGAGRDLNGQHAAATTAFERAELGGEAECPSALAGRAIEQRRRRHRRSERAHGGEFGKDIQISGAGQAVSTDRDSHSRGVEVAERWRPRPGVAVAAGTGNERGAARRKTGEVAARHLDAVHGEHPGFEKTGLLEVLHRTDPGRGPLRIPGADIFEQRPPRSTPRREKLHFRRRLRQVHAARRQTDIPVHRPPQGTEDSRRDRIWRMRREAGPEAGPGGERVNLLRQPDGRAQRRRAD